jgi:DNA-binding PadR family transcriptional regulator
LEPIQERGDQRRHRHHPRGTRGAREDAAAGGRHDQRRRGGGRRGRAPRGDVRTAILLLIEQQPMHGYHLMQTIAERSGGAWTPSPGAVYPTISQLQDEGLVTITADAGRRLVALTDAGRAQLAEHRDMWGDPFAGYDAAGAGVDLRRLVGELADATRQVGRAGSDEQRDAAAKILVDARRSIYLLLADSVEGTREA